MGKETNIGKDGTIFKGEDKIFHLGGKPDADPAVAKHVLDENGVPVDMSSWGANEVFFVVARTNAGSPLFTVQAVRNGTYNADPKVNTQRWTATVTDDQMTFTLEDQGEPLRYSWKRIAAGVDTILAYGEFFVEHATQH